MTKAAFTPLYISAVWVLLISYQLFTQTAVVSVLSYLNVSWPSTLSEWLVSREELIIFIHGFAWVFVLSSVIPSVLLGKERSVILQFLVCLILTLISLSIRDIFPLLYEGQINDQILNVSVLLCDPVFAGIYLSAPYFLMLFLDIHSKRIKTENKETSESLKS